MKSCFRSPEILLRLDRVFKEALERWKDSLVLLMRKLTLSNPARIVLKSPPHLGRVSTLLEIFPRAQFVHIVRDPYRVYVSTLKLWTDGFGPAHLQIPEPKLVDEIILSWYVELFSLFERDKGLIPAGSLYEMKFEDLKPNRSKLYEECRLGLTGLF
jgi:hypothetical protein